MLLATLNRNEYVIQSVKYLQLQTYQNFEIIIVDQSDNIHNELKLLDNRINYIHIEKKGLSHARNIGLKYVTGDYVCLVDDDGFYKDPETLKKIFNFLKNKNITVCCGNIYDEKENRIKGSAKDKKVTFRTSLLYSQSPSMVIETNFIKEKRFDENLGIGSKYGSTEESEIVLAALSQKKLCIYTNCFTINHPLPTSSDYSVEKWVSYSRGFGAAMKKCKVKYSKFWAYYLLLKSTIRRLGAYLVIHRIKNKAALTNDIEGLKALWHAYKEYKV